MGEKNYIYGFSNNSGGDIFGDWFGNKNER